MSNNSSILFYRPKNVTGPVDMFFVNPNNWMEGYFGIGIIITVFMISFISLLGFGPRRAFAAASFINFISSMILFAFGIISTGAFTLAAVMLVAAAIFNWGGS